MIDSDLKDFTTLSDEAKAYVTDTLKYFGSVEPLDWKTLAKTCISETDNLTVWSMRQAAAELRHAANNTTLSQGYRMKAGYSMGSGYRERSKYSPVNGWPTIPLNTYVAYPLLWSAVNDQLGK